MSTGVNSMTPLLPMHFHFRRHVARLLLCYYLPHGNKTYQLMAGRFNLYCHTRSILGNAVGTVTVYGMDDRRVAVRVPEGSRIFTFLLSRPTLVSTQPPIQWVPEALSLGIKRQGCEADLSSPSSAEFKKTWIYISTLSYVFVV
jgi:hypothetical protein